jgi:hypothetical protein
MTPRNDDEQGLRPALWAIALTGALLTLASPFVLGRGGVVGVALGSAIASLNLWALGRIVRAFTNGAGLPWAILGALKLFGLLAVIAVVLKLGITSVLPLTIGYAALPVGIVVAQLSAARPRAATSPSLGDGIDRDSGSKGR